ncbi:hypothetical protein HYC85_004135 [Camellia sinensis]|uniref:Uncharacterized protein n=1 Tax=Camellia sinensis TaxID=4442 RepID=A0A7J7HVM8_CAMSI|nr:hypothetical protein HYC85_004135 [Camellia sinensis]
MYIYYKQTEHQAKPKTEHETNICKYMKQSMKPKPKTDLLLQPKQKTEHETNTNRA